MSRNKYPEETERKILDVAFRLFSEKGYDHTTIQDIVDGLGMSKGAVYHHFKNKEEIIGRLYSAMAPDVVLTTQLTLDDASLTGLEKLRKLLQLQLSHREKLKVDSLISAPAARRDPRLVFMQLQSSVLQVGPSLQSLIEAGNADGSISAPYPKETAEVIGLLLNAWVGLFPGTREEYTQKLNFLAAMTEAMGVPLFDDALMATAQEYYSCFEEDLCQS